MLEKLLTAKGNKVRPISINQGEFSSKLEELSSNLRNTLLRY